MNASKVKVALAGLSVGTVVFLGSCFFASADSAPPQLMSYQGFLTDTDGNPIGSTNGVSDPVNYQVVFRIYENEEAVEDEVAIWSELQTVTFDNGVFSVILGNGSQYNSESHPLLDVVFDNSQAETGLTASERYIGITVLDLDPSGDTELIPRLKLLTSPFSFLTYKALVADKLSSSEIEIDTTGNVVLKQNLSVEGDATISSSVTASGLFSDADSDIDGALGVNSLSSSGSVTASGSLEGATLSVSNAGSFGDGLTVGGQIIAADTSDAEGDNLDGGVLIGDIEGLNMGLDGNEIQVRDVSGSTISPATLFLNNDGGNVNIGNSASEVDVPGSITAGDISVGDLSVSGSFTPVDITLSNSLSVGNDITVADDLTVTDDVNISGSLILKDTSNLTGSSISGLSDSVSIEKHIEMRTEGTISKWLIGQEDTTSDHDLHFIYYDNTSWSASAYLDPGGSWQKVSDERVKKDIEPIGDGVLDKLMELVPVRYHRTFHEQNERKEFGFIAQQVAEIFPDVPLNKDGWYSLNYDDFSILAISAIQQLRNEKDEEILKLEERNTVLENENRMLLDKFKELEARLDKIENKIP